MREYTTPSITDAGSVADVTAAGSMTGNFDANYSQGQPIPPNGPGDGGVTPPPAPFS